MYDVKSVGTIALRLQKSSHSTSKLILVCSVNVLIEKKKTALGIEFWYGHVTEDMVGYNSILI